MNMLSKLGSSLPLQNHPYTGGLVTQLMCVGRNTQLFQALTLVEKDRNVKIMSNRISSVTFVPLVDDERY